MTRNQIASTVQLENFAELVQSHLKIALRGFIVKMDGLRANPVSLAIIAILTVQALIQC